MFLINHVYAGTNKFETKRKLLNSVGFQLGEGTKVVGPMYCSATLTAGKNCWIGRNLCVNGNGSVVIGNNCDIAPEVSFFTGGHEIGDRQRRAGKGEVYTIEIGDGTWVGARSSILRDTKVGKGCVIAAGSCVIKDILDNSLVGGVPARIIREINDKEDIKE